MTPRAVKLAYQIFQKGSQAVLDPPLVLAHGMFGNQRNFQPIAERLSQQNLKVMTVDMRNHGESPHDPQMNFFAMAEDLSEFLEDREAKDAVLLGHSMGGKAAMVLALTQPSKISKLIVEDVAPCSHVSSVGTVFRPLLAAMRKTDFSEAKNLSEARAVARQNLFKVLPDKSTTDFIVTNVIAGTYTYKWRVNVKAFENSLDEVVGFPKMSQTFKGKTLFIKGEKSDLINEESLPEIERLFPNHRIETVPRAGHLVHAEAPNEFCELVNRFLEEP